jgi:hypothetical protein
LKKKVEIEHEKPTRSFAFRQEDYQLEDSIEENPRESLRNFIRNIQNGTRAKQLQSRNRSTYIVPMMIKVIEN